MEVQLTKTYDHGFILTEAGLRRVLDILKDQLAKLPSPQQFDPRFRLRYRNGAVATDLSLDDVLAEDNSGSAQIVDLTVTCGQKSSGTAPVAALSFRDLGVERQSDTSPISLTIESESRDWVFVTISLLEERIQRLRQSRTVQLLARLHVLAYLFVAQFAFMLAFFSYDYMKASRLEYPEQPPATARRIMPGPAEALKTARARGELHDMVDALIVVESARHSLFMEFEDRPTLTAEYRAWLQRRNDWFTKHQPQPLWAWTTLFVSIPLILMLGVSQFLRRYYPTYFFAWGEAAEVLKKKEATRKFIIVVIVVGLAVSFVGGILANLVRRPA